MRLKVIFLNTLLMLILLGSASAQVQLVPASSFSNTQQSTTATTLQNTDVVITSSNLQAGETYLVMYSAAYGGSTTSNDPEVAVSYGGTTIAVGSDEGSSSGTPEAMRDGSLHGYYVLTGDGTSDLRIQFRSTNSGTAYITGKSLIAIPLSTLALDQDYWFAQQNGDAASATTTSSFTNILRCHSAGDHIVLFLHGICSPISSP